MAWGLKRNPLPSPRLEMRVRAKPLLIPKPDPLCIRR